MAIVIDDEDDSERAGEEDAFSIVLVGSVVLVIMTLTVGEIVFVTVGVNVGEIVGVNVLVARGIIFIVGKMIMNFFVGVGVFVDVGKIICGMFIVGNAGTQAYTEDAIKKTKLISTNNNPMSCCIYPNCIPIKHPLSNIQYCSNDKDSGSSPE